MKKHQLLKAVLITLPMLFFSFLSYAQSLTVSGIVQDETGYALPGVAVAIQGTLQGTITDVEGRYTITVDDPNSVLTFSFIGMEAQNVNVAGRSVINVFLKTEFADLDEVVVVGYGVQKKKLVTGSNISIGAEELQRQSSTKALESMQSISPGVNIVQASGMPGEDFKVNIRGLGTVGQSAPLYVIDGVAGGDINSLNPSDIESIDVLKDAASAAIYGSRAANEAALSSDGGFLLSVPDG